MYVDCMKRFHVESKNYSEKLFPLFCVCRHFIRHVSLNYSPVRCPCRKNRGKPKSFPYSKKPLMHTFLISSNLVSVTPRLPGLGYCKKESPSFCNSFIIK